jgi:hypothetical protein
MTDRARVIAALQAGPLYGGERLSDAGRAELLEAAGEIEGNGGRVAIVVLPPGEPLGKWRSLWDDLGLSPDRDLLLLYSGAWDARGLGLTASEIDEILAENAGALSSGAGHGLAAGVRALRDGAGVGAGGRGGLGTGTLVGVAGLALAGGAAFFLWRREQVARETALATATAEVEQAAATLVASAGALGDGGHELREQAARLRDEIRRVPAGLAVGQRIGRMRQLGREVGTLQARVHEASRPQG